MPLTEEQIQRRANEIGQRQAFPSTFSQTPGMTYRMWLVGQAIIVSYECNIDKVLRQLAEHEIRLAESKYHEGTVQPPPRFPSWDGYEWH